MNDFTETHSHIPSETQNSEKNSFLANFEKSLTKTPGRLLEKLIWHMNNNMGVSNDGLQDTEKYKFQISGILRGELAEKLSETFPLSECETIFVSGKGVGDLKQISFYERVGSSSKDALLQKAVEKSLKEKPLNIDAYYRDDESVENYEKVVIQEIISGHGSRRDENGQGIFYGTTILPDFFLYDVNDPDKIKGFGEVKAYTPEEMTRLIEELEGMKQDSKLINPFCEVKVGNKSLKLGANIAGEIEFIDTIRAVAFGEGRLETQMPFVLRFPKDIEPKDLIAYGKTLQGLHFTNFIIQVLPLTSDELNQRSKKLVADNMGMIREDLDEKAGKESESTPDNKTTDGRQAMKFDKAQIETLENFAGK